MPYPRHISDQVLIKLALKGVKDQEIADELGVSRQAVQARRVKLLGKTGAYKINDLLRHRWPDVPLDAGPHWHLRQVKAWLRLKYGDTMDPTDVRFAESWISERAEDQMVLDYDPSREDPWYLRERRPEDGRLLVDWPADIKFPTKKFQQALELPTEK